LFHVFFSRTTGIPVNDGVVCFGVDAELANLESGRLFSAMPEMRATDPRPGHCTQPLGKIALSSPHFEPLMTRYSLHALNFVINVMQEPGKPDRNGLNSLLALYLYRKTK